MAFEFTRRDLVDWGSALLVFVSGAMTGHYAATGMNLVQGMGAAVAITGSVAVAVAVRAWPMADAVKTPD